MSSVDWLEYHKSPVTLHSGDKSHWLVRGDLIFKDVDLRVVVLRRWKALLPFCAEPRDYIGIERGGVEWAEALAEFTKGKAYAMSTPELEEWGHMLHGKPDKPLVVVDDVTTTGSSLKLVPHADNHIVVVDRRRQLLHPDDKILAWARIPLPLVQEEKS